jgi:dihydroorotase
MGTRRIANVLTVRAGEIVYDRDARAFADWAPAGRDATSAVELPRPRANGPEASAAAGANTTTDPIYDLLLKNGHVIDPSTGRNGRFDVAIVGERIVRIAPNLPAQRARTAVDASAYYVTPGLIDMHAYVNAQGVFRQGDPRTAWRNVNPDHNTLRHGVTTVVDGGSTGWRGFDSFKQLVIDRSQVRVLAFLNIVGSGMVEGQSAADVAELDVEKAIETARREKATIVGIRSSHLTGGGADGITRTIRAAEATGGVALVEYLQNDDIDFRRLALELVRPGDLITPAYEPGMAGVDARRRGVLFDVGHSSRFSFRQAVPAVRKGFLPDVISTAMDKTSLLLPRADMMTTLSKFLNIGVPLEQLIERATVRPARAIKRPELAALREGGLADIAVIEMQTGRFGFLDGEQKRLRGNRRLRAVLTIRKGEVVWDSEGLSHTDWSKAGPYTNYR